MKQILSVISLLIVSLGVYAQNVGINTSGTRPDTSAILDLNTGNTYTSPNGKGLIIPNVKLASSIDAITIATPATSLLVYVPAGSGLTPPGYYYNSGTSSSPVWTQLSTGNGGGSYVKDSAWLLTGNSGTNPTNNWLGTNDGEALQFKVNGQKSGWIDYTGNNNTSYGYKTINSSTTGPNTAFGYEALQNNTVGYNNVAIGYQSMLNLGNGNSNGHQNVAVGDYTLQSSSITYVNTALGYEAATNTVGNYNTAVGGVALYNNTGSQNIAIGASAIYQGSGSNDIGIGQNALYNASTSNNTIVGWEAASQAAITGGNNNALGAQTFYKLTSGANSEAIGYQALFNNTSGSGNDAVGYNAMLANTTGQGNVAVGENAMLTNVSGQQNVAIGQDAMASGAGATGSQNTTIGNQSLNFNTTGSNNVALGMEAMYDNTTGSNNIGIGTATAWNNHGANYNTFIGYNSASLTGGITGNNNSAIGAYSLDNITSGTENDAVGYQALYSNNTGSNNVANGYEALYSGTSLTGNVAIGSQALYSSIGSSGGAQNTAVGYQSLYSVNSTSGFGFNNTAVGYQAGYSNSTGIHNTSLGASALYNDNGGSWNTAVGEKALYNQSAGSPSLPGNGTGNTAMGFEALYNNSTGALGAGQNSAFGVYALQTNTTGSYNSALGYQADITPGTLTNATAIGAYVQATSSNSVVLGSNGVVAGSTAVTQVDFNGALEPYYTGAYQPAASGQILTSQGGGTAPKWLPPAAVTSYVKDSAWLLTGNSGTTYGTNFLGSIDDQGLQLRVFNSKAGRIEDINAANGAYGNTSFGYLALNASSGAYSNVAIGKEALRNNITADRNVAVGDSALAVSTSSTGNTAVGYQSLVGNSSFNTAVGYQAIGGTDLGANMTGIGYQALYKAGVGKNTAVGYQALYNGGDVNNTAVGYQALTALTSLSSSLNTALGSQALASETSGGANTALGASALYSNISGGYNTAVGEGALYSNTGTSTPFQYNTAVGYNAMYNNSTGTFNVAVGYDALNTNVLSSYNIAIGYQADVTADGFTNATAIGYNAKVGQSNALVLGGTGGSSVNVGIGTTTPAQTLHVVQSSNAGSDFGAYNITAQIENSGAYTDAFLYLKGSTNTNNYLSGIIQTGRTTGFYTGLNNSYNYRIGGITAITPNTVGGAAQTALTNAKDGSAGITVVESNGNVGVDYTTPANPLDVNGSVAVGTYAGTAAPANGMIVSGQVGIDTTAPAASAALDVNSTSSGMLVPRMTTTQMNAIASPSLSLMVFNITTSCFMFYNGTTWQAMACTCSGPPSTPGAITGATSFCPGATGTYSITPIVGVNYYTWTVPTGSTIISGQGTNSIAVTYGSTSGNVFVTATNNCGTSAPSNSLTITNGTPAIITQPTSPAAVCNSLGTSSFTVVASGAPLTYQWQEWAGSSWNNLINGSYYSGVLTATLTITNPPLSMNGYMYRCIVSGTCSPSVTTNGLSTLTVEATYLPITILNSQSSATSNNQQVMITINSSTYSAYESTGLQNVEFTTGPGGSGSTLQAWIESGANSSSASTVYWVNLGTNTIPASSSLIIYMDFMPTTVMTAAGPTGEAPENFGGSNYATSYAQYDNGSFVFPTFYDNFNGSSFSANWSTYTSGTITGSVSNGLTISTTASQGTFVINSVSSYAPPFIAETDAQGSTAESATRSYMPGLISTTGSTEGANITDNQTTPYPTSYITFSNGRSSLIEYSFLEGTASTTVYNLYQSAAPAGYNIWGLSYNTASTNNVYKNYAAEIVGGTSADSPSGNLYFAIGIGTYAAETSSLNAYWSRIRTYPPSGVLPSASTGTISCP